MVTNQQDRQVEIASELEEAARTLAHSTRDVPSPFDSYRLLSELTATVEHLEQTCGQLAAWHRGVVDGKQYAGEDHRGDGATGTITAATQLDAARDALAQAATALGAAHAANGVVRWIGE